MALLCYLSPSLTGLMLSVVPPVFVGGMFFGRSVKKLSKDAQRALAKTTELGLCHTIYWNYYSSYTP